MIIPCGSAVHYNSLRKGTKSFGHATMASQSTLPLGLGGDPTICSDHPSPPFPHPVGSTVSQPHVQMHLQSSCPRIGLVRFFFPGAHHAAMGGGLLLSGHSPVGLRCSRSTSEGINFGDPLWLPCAKSSFFSPFFPLFSHGACCVTATRASVWRRSSEKERRGADG